MSFLTSRKLCKTFKGILLFDGNIENMQNILAYSNQKLSLICLPQNIDVDTKFLSYKLYNQFKFHIEFQKKLLFSQNTIYIVTILY